MDGTEDHCVKQSKPGSESQCLHVFSHIWKTDSKDKHIHNYKHVIYICVYIYIYTIIIAII
jgi:hypothetical protein